MGWNLKKINDRITWNIYVYVCLKRFKTDTISIVLQAIIKSFLFQIV